MGLRALVKLEAASSFPYDLRYHHNLQGFIYAQIKGTNYSDLHHNEVREFSDL
jgi:CRISPR/Cas system endoribonuclease Cas6 (RAMP superfamily)